MGVKKFLIDSNNSLEASLVSHYKFDDLSDYYGINTLQQVAMTFVAGKVGNCVQLPGANDSAKLYYSGYITSLGASVSIAGWVYVPDAVTPGGIFNIGTGGGWGLGVGSVNWDGPGNHLIGLIGGLQWMDFGVNIGTGWHFIAMTADSASKWRGYIDGVVCATTYTRVPNAPSGNVTFFGACNGNTTQAASARRFYNARLDAFEIYNKELTPQEILDLMNNTDGQEMEEVSKLTLIREQIKTSIESITGTAPYNYSYTEKVALNRKTQLDPSEDLYVNIRLGNFDKNAELLGGSLNYWQRFADLEIDIERASGILSEEEALNAEEDIERLIKVNQKWNNYAYHTEYLGTNLVKDQQERTISMATIKIRVHYMAAEWSQ